MAELTVGLHLSQPWAGPLAAWGPQSQVGVGRPLRGYRNAATVAPEPAACGHLSLVLAPDRTMRQR